MTFQGHVENGVVVFDEATTVPEGARVEVTFLPESDQKGEPKRVKLRDRLKSVIGKAENMPADASVNLDHYLYGAPKVEDRIR
jgi:hypothetical protein